MRNTVFLRLILSLAAALAAGAGVVLLVLLAGDSGLADVVCNSVNCALQLLVYGGITLALLAALLAGVLTWRALRRGRVSSR